jgi:pyruvate dehydrogenase E2 component (dihydrolipoamide acetyltransferase)
MLTVPKQQHRASRSFVCLFPQDTVGLFDISKNIRDLMGKVQDGQLTSADVSGGTFSVTNLGMYGVKTASSVINSPQAAHLTIGTIEKRIIPNDGAFSKTFLVSFQFSS